VIAAPETRPARELRTSSELEPIAPVSLFAKSMGGRLVVHLDADGRASDAKRSSRRVVDRIDRWAARLTRYTAGSDLSALNADPRLEVPVRPTLAAALRAGRSANEASEGLADITLLDARLAAESGSDPSLASSAIAFRDREWLISRGRRGAAVVRRPPGLRFDLGGVGKGWIADRALEMLAAWPSAVIEATWPFGALPVDAGTWAWATRGVRMRTWPCCASRRPPGDTRLAGEWRRPESRSIAGKWTGRSATT
jgi:hypothetical protein